MELIYPAQAGFIRRYFSLFFCAAVLLCVNPAAAVEVKLANAAGMFYPDDPAELQEMVSSYLASADVDPRETGQILALIVPHAGYGFSGKTAAHAYRLLSGRPYKTVVVLAASHHYRFSGISVWPSGYLRTPLGDVEVDSAFTSALLKASEKAAFDPQAFQKEHSLEVQLPFLQTVLLSDKPAPPEPAKTAGWKVVPVVFGDCSLFDCQQLASVLASLINGRQDVLVVASSDMYHGYEPKQAEITDNLTLSCIKNNDSQALYHGIRDGKLQLCGALPVVVALALAEETGYNKLSLLDYTNSAIVSGNQEKKEWTVGYAACVISKERSARPMEKKEGFVMLNQEQKRKLLSVARESIRAYLEEGKRIEVDQDDPVLAEKSGAFVTLRKGRSLRGCIGHISADEPLVVTVREMAIAAACNDSRFSPVSPSEMEGIEIEISALSPPVKVGSTDDIRMGEHGVIIRRGARSGVFLPQVAVETGWSKEEFLRNLCVHKAGLDPAVLSDKETEIYVFTATVFAEKSVADRK